MTSLKKSITDWAIQSENNKTMNELKQELEKHLKMEGLSGIHIAVIMKYMDIAYVQGERDQLAKESERVKQWMEELKV